MSSKHETENGEVNVYSTVPKHWVSSDSRYLLYPPTAEFPNHPPSTWNEKMFSTNIFPKSTWMEYDICKIFNEKNCRMFPLLKWNFFYVIYFIYILPLVGLVKANKKARELQCGLVDPSKFFDSDQNLGRRKEGSVRSLRQLASQNKHGRMNCYYLSFFCVFLCFFSYRE